MIGRTILQYRILEHLGAGGMGDVYKAHDTQLNRLVALKFPPEHLADNTAEVTRLRHEALAVSTLVHPNVVVLFEISEHQGLPFLVMEYFEAESLKHVVEDKVGELTLLRVLDIAV